MFCSAAAVSLSLATPSAHAADGSFVAGDRVVALVRTPVKDSPDGARVLAQPLPGGHGTIGQGPRSAGGELWWRVAFDEGFAGWTREGDLQIQESGVKAFPTAEGFGAKALGGRGGAVIEVTNLDDSGPGSLRHAVEQAGPRTIVFRVGGTIKVHRPIRIRDPYITIAGQTAPGDGIMIRNLPVNGEPPLTVETHDVVIRHLRLRPGPSGVPSCCVDALGLMDGTRNVMIDHVSMSWAVDENLGASGDASDFTVQWSILSEALRRGGHADDETHSRGLLVSTEEGGGNVSIHHNLFAHNEGRNPEVALSYGVADIVNNVLYNPNFRMIEISEANGKPYANVVGNIMRNGENTKINNPHINNHIVRARDVEDGALEGFVMYVVGNVDELFRTDDDMPEEISVIEEDRRFLAAERQPAPFVPTTRALQAFEDVLNRAGATLPRRDSVDERIIEEVDDYEGEVIDDPSEVGWPKLANGTPPVDTDRDGMPDDWEQRLGLDPQDPADRNGDVTGNGYTNLEDYLNELAGDIRISRPSGSASLKVERQG